MPLQLEELEAFARTWREAEGQVVQHWEVWESAAAKFFGWQENNIGEMMHQIMHVVCAVCLGAPAHVRKALRDATPSTLELCRQMFHHLPHLSAVVDAETRYRQRLLVGDWTIILRGKGQLTVRTIHKKFPTETEH